MTIVILLVLVIAWAVALLPAWFRKRSQSRAANSILLFREHLSTLQRATPAGRRGSIADRSTRWAQYSRARARAAARRRRRDVLSTLAAVTVLTLALAVALGGVAVMAFLLSAALLVTYASLLVRMQRRFMQRAKVRYLVTRQVEPEPTLLLRRSASN